MVPVKAVVLLPLMFSVAFATDEPLAFSITGATPEKLLAEESETTETLLPASASVGATGFGPSPVF